MALSWGQRRVPLLGACRSHPQVCLGWDVDLLQLLATGARSFLHPFPLHATFFPALLQVSPPRVPSCLINALFLITWMLSRPTWVARTATVAVPLWVSLWLSLELQTLAMVEGRRWHLMVSELLGPSALAPLCCLGSRLDPT